MDLRGNKVVTVISEYAISIDFYQGVVNKAKEARHIRTFNLDRTEQNGKNKCRLKSMQ